MNTQKVPTKNTNNSPILVNINKYLWEIQTRYKNQASRFTSERKQKSNKLLFGITVAALTSIMVGAIFLAFCQSQPQKTSTNYLSSRVDKL